MFNFLARDLLYPRGMGRPLRYMPEPHTLYEVTCRTVQGRFLLRPSARLNDLVRGVIGRSLHKFDVRLYLFVVVSNHMHLILSTPDTSTLSAFMCYLASNLAKEAGRLHGWREKFWGRRYSATAILDDESLRHRVRYVLSHGCKEGLVAQPGDWPGVHCVKALVHGEKLAGRWIDRTGESEANKRRKDWDPDEFSTRYEVPLTPLPCLEGRSETERCAWWRAMVADIEAETRERLAREKRGVLGRQRILAQDPHGRPDRPKRSPRPICHAASKEAIRFFRQAYELFVEIYRLAQERFKKGELKSLSQFPPDCYIPPFVYSSYEASLAPG